MNYLAIKDNKGKGVYQYKTKEEKKEILKNLGLSQKAGKVFDNKNEALKYANTKEVANREQRVVEDIDFNTKSKKFVNTSTQKTSRNQVLATLELYKNKGYDLVEIEMSNGNKFDIVLNNFYYISSNIITPERPTTYCEDRKDGRYVYVEGYNLTLSHGVRDALIYEDNYTDVYVKKMYEILDGYNKYLDKKYSSSSYIKNYLNISDIVKYSHKVVTSRYDNSFYRTMNKTKIDSVGDILIFNEVCNLKLVKEKDDWNSTKFNYYKKENLINDYAINSSHIVSLKPSKCSFKINDKDVISVIEDLELEMIETEKHK